MSLKHKVRPLTTEARARIRRGWNGKVAKPVRSQFKAPWSDTMWLLEHELESLGVKGEFILQLDISEADIRIDNNLRASARPATEDVAISIESKRGPLLFTCSRFTSWKDNVRAIALGLEALRKVDRYGITQSDEQYTGFRALPSATPMLGGSMTLEGAAEFLIEHGSTIVQQYIVADVIGQPSTIDALYRRAAKKLHPDAGGSEALFLLLAQARDILTGGSL